MLVDLRRPLIYVKPKKCASTSVEMGLDWLLWGEASDPTTYQEQRFLSRRPGGFVTHLRHNQARWKLIPGDDVRGIHSLRQLMVYRRRVMFGLTFDLAQAEVSNPLWAAREVVRRFNPHTSVSEIKKTLGDRFWSRAFKVTVVRNPWDTVVSDFYWSTRNENPPKVDFATYAANYCAPLVQREIAEAGHEFDFILRYESLDTDFQRLAETLGRGNLDISLPRAKSNIRPKQTADYRAMFNAITRTRVGEAFRAYNDRFGYEF